MKFKAIRFVVTVFVVMCATTASHAGDDQSNRIKNVVDAAIRPVMVKYGIPGIAVGVSVAGTTHVFDYGEATTATHQPVTHDTLFELGSVTKVFTATLAAYAQVCGYLSLADETSKYLPPLRDSKFGGVSLLDLGTHTPGGLPLQVPDNTRNDDQLMQYFKEWQPTYAPGTYRTYSNLGIGTLGLITAKSIGRISPG